MAIEFVCPSCGRALKLRDEAAGKRGRCPHCKAVITVPENAVSEDDLIEIVPTQPSGPPKPPPLPPKSPEPEPEAPPSIEPSADEPVEPVKVPDVPPEPAKPEGKVCPGCGSPLAEGAVICVKCGLNLKTGKKLQTVFEEPEPEPEPEVPEAEEPGTTEDENPPEA